jgi:hypothetical protein
MNLMPVISTVQAITQDQVVTQQEALILTLMTVMVVLVMIDELEV